MDFVLSILAKVFSNMFKDWRRDVALKEAGKTEQRLDNMVEAARQRVESDATFVAVESGNEDLRGDL